MANNQEAATIEALTKQFSESFKARDFSAIGGMYTNDAVLCPPNSNVITGKRNIQTFWERNAAIQSLRFDSVSVKVLSENAIRAVGTFTLQVKAEVNNANALAAAGPQTRQVNAKYVFVWQKVGDEWKIESSIWNRIGPERGNFPMPAAIRRLPQNNQGDAAPGGMGPGGGPRGGGMGPGGGPRGGGMGPGGGPRGGGMGPGGGPRGGGMGPGGGPRGMGPGGGPRGMGPGGGPRGGMPGGAGGGGAGPGGSAESAPRAHGGSAGGKAGEVSGDEG